MSSRSERAVTHVILGDGDASGLAALLSASGGRVTELRLTGAPGDARLLLEVLASSDQVVFSPWPAAPGSDAPPRPVSASAADRATR